MKQRFNPRECMNNLSMTENCLEIDITLLNLDSSVLNPEINSTDDYINYLIELLSSENLDKVKYAIYRVRSDTINLFDLELLFNSKVLLKIFKIFDNSIITFQKNIIVS